MSGVRRSSSEQAADSEAATAALAPGRRRLTASRYPALGKHLGAPREGEPTIHDAATAAVDHKDGGAPVDPGVAGRVGAHLGADFSGVRVHSDLLAQQATAAMGARAFAYGSDVFLGPGESGGNLGLMAHELTHVVQQGAAGQRAPQRAVTVGEAHSPAEHQADQVAAEVTGGTGRPAALLVDDAPVGPGQMLKSQFLDQLRAQVTDAANQELGPVYSAIGCPYIEQYFGRYARQPASAGEALLRRFAPATRSAKAAGEMIPAVVARVREGVRAWRDTGAVPPELAAVEPAAAQAAGPAQAQALRAPNGTPEQVMAALGDGAPIDDGVASRMGGAFGTSFADVRVHTDAGSAAMAQQQGALAFTVGNHVAFAPGRYNPGSIEGDALFAHELAHVLQQRGATPGGSTSASHGAEADADRGAAAAVKNLHGGSTEKASVSMTSGYQLQRCSGAGVDKGLMGGDLKGKFLGQKVGEDHTDILAPFSPSIDSKITATRTLGAFDTEAAACAIVKANGKPGAVTVEDGKFVGYETDIGFTYRESYTPDMSGMGGGTQFHPPKLAPGVIVLISNEMMEVRAGQFDPGAKDDQQGSAGQQMNSTADPFVGYKQALGDSKGDMNSVADDKLLAAFDAALKDTALVVLNKSKQQVEAKQDRFADNGAGLSDTELDQMKSTAQLLADDDAKISASKDKLFKLRLLRGLSTDPDDLGLTENPLDPDLEAEQKNLQQLQTVRKIHVARYPLLSRVDPAKFKDLSKEDMARQLGGELPGILKDIETTKQNVADGSINLWEVDQVVDATIAGFGLDETKRKVIADKRKAKAQQKTVATIVFTVFAIGFGLAAVFATGGTALFFAAGAFGLSTFDAMRQTEQYAIDKPASNVDLDKDAGFTAPPGWGWLVVAWIGVGLDGLQVASAVGKIAKAEKTIAEAATELATDAKRLGMTQDELIAKLRQVAGDVDGAAKITESTKGALAGKLGLPVEIDPKLVGDVRVYYEVDKATGRAVVKSVAAGPEATLAEVLAHESVINMMRRYEGVTGRLRELWDKLLAIVGKSPKDVNPFPAGSKAYDSWNELYKLPDLVDAQFAKYKNGLTAANESSLANDLEILEEQARRHQKVVDEMVLEGGSNFVAKTGDSTRAAVSAGYPLVPGATSAEDMLAKGYYYRLAANGSDYELVRKAQAVGPQLRVEKDAAGALKLVPAVEKLDTLIPDAAQLARLRAIVTDDAHLAMLFDKVKDATRLENLLKGVANDIAKLETLLGKVASAADLERLLKAIPVAELEPIVNGVKQPEQLALVLQEVGDYSGGKMLQQWGAKSQFDKIDQFMQRLSSGVGKELAETSAVGAKSIIIDSNTAIALIKDADPALKPTMNAGEIARVAYIKSLPPGTELRFGNVVVGEVGSGAVSGVKGLPITVLRDSADYQKVLTELERLNVGAGKGAADRALVADAFFAKADTGVTPTFMTGDKAIYNKLATAAGIDVSKLGGKTLFDFTGGGFNVTIEGHTIRVIPIGQ